MLDMYQSIICETLHSITHYCSFTSTKYKSLSTTKTIVLEVLKNRPSLSGIYIVIHVKYIHLINSILLLNIH